MMIDLDFDNDERIRPSTLTEKAAHDDPHPH